MNKLKEFHEYFTKTRDNLRRYEIFLQSKNELHVKKEENITEIDEYESTSLHVNEKLVVEINDLKEIKQESPLFSCHFRENRSDCDESDKETEEEENRCRCGRTYKRYVSREVL